MTHQDLNEKIDGAVAQERLVRRSAPLCKHGEAGCGQYYDLLANIMKINDIIKDNDPRVGNRLLIIESFDGPDHVRARRILSDGRRNSYPKKGFRIAIKRIHTDGKKRKSGFSLANAELRDRQPERPQISTNQ